MDDREKVIDQLHRRIDWMTQDREILLKGVDQLARLQKLLVKEGRDKLRLLSVLRELRDAYLTALEPTTAGDPREAPLVSRADALIAQMDRRNAGG